MLESLLGSCAPRSPPTSAPLRVLWVPPFLTLLISKLMLARKTPKALVGAELVSAPSSPCSHRSPPSAVVIIATASAVHQPMNLPRCPRTFFETPLLLMLPMTLPSAWPWLWGSRAPESWAGPVASWLFATLWGRTAGATCLCSFHTSQTARRCALFDLQLHRSATRLDEDSCPGCSGSSAPSSAPWPLRPSSTWSRPSEVERSAPGSHP